MRAVGEELNAAIGDERMAHHALEVARSIRVFRVVGAPAAVAGLVAGREVAAAH